MNTLFNAVNTSAVVMDVLLKDKVEPTSIGAGASKSLANMETSRINWEQGAYRTSNQALYAVLAECLAFCGELTIAEAKQRSSSLETFYKERGYRYNKELPLATRVVRAVFGDINRRRVSTYSIVLRKAQKDGVSASSLATWIEDCGGIQEISLGHSSTYISPNQKAEIAKTKMKGKAPIGFAKSELLSYLADADFVGEPCVLLAEQQADGSFGVHAVLRQDGLVKSAFSALYAVQLEALEKAKAEVDAANDADGAVAKSA